MASYLRGGGRGGDAFVSDGGNASGGDHAAVFRYHRAAFSGRRVFAYGVSSCDDPEMGGVSAVFDPYGHGEDGVYHGAGLAQAGGVYRAFGGCVGF